MTKPVAYTSHGLPLDAYQVTAQDRQRLADARAIKAAASQHFRDEPPPPLTSEQIAKLRYLLRLGQAPEPESLAAWTIRLTCGHITTTTTHRSHTTPIPSGLGARACMECGDEQVIVAWEFREFTPPKPKGRRR